METQSTLLTALAASTFETLTPLGDGNVFGSLEMMVSGRTFETLTPLGDGNATVSVSVVMYTPPYLLKRLPL